MEQSSAVRTEKARWGWSNGYTHTELTNTNAASIFTNEELKRHIFTYYKRASEAEKHVEEFNSFTSYILNAMIAEIPFTILRGATKGENLAW